MIKNRSLILGIGIGMIIGAVLLQLVNIGKGQTMLSGMQLTPEQIQQAAQAQDMQVYSSDQQVFTREEWEKQEAEAKAKQEETEASDSQAKAQSETKEPTNETPTAPESPEQPAAGDNESTTAPEQPQTSQTESASKPVATAVKNPSAPASSNIQFKINNGELLNDVAYNLKNEGLIDSQRDFINRASELNANTKLQIGTYELTAGSSYDDIIKALTRQSSR